MKQSIRWVAIPLLGFAAACGGDDVDDDLELPDLPPVTPAAEQAPMEPAGMPETVQIEEVEGSGIGGEVSITGQGSQTEVMVRLAGTPPNATLPGHIHSGSCAEIGGVIQPLEEITTDAAGTGTATSTVEVAPMAVMDGQHIVVYHGEGMAPAACAAIPEHEM